MKIVQSFWSGGKSDIMNSHGWYSYKFNWLSWILSCNQLVHYHEDVELYTDEFGYSILIEKLKLPYTKVHVVLDQLNNFDSKFWALSKIKTYQLQDEPFLHVDGDVFVWESLTNKFINSNLISQNLEVTTKYYRDNWENIHPQLSYIPTEIKDYHEGRSNYACNMGIVGGNNIIFFKEYTSKSFEFVKMNELKFDDKDALNFNIFFEQVLFYEMSRLKNEKVDFLINEISLDNDYKGFGDFDKVPDKSYLHLLGDFKRNPSVCKSMEIHIMKHYPESYSLLMKIINENENSINEIDFLDSKKVKELIGKFKNELKKNSFDKEDFLIKRDLYNHGLGLRVDKLLRLNINFKIVKLNCFQIKTEITEAFKIKYIEIEEYNHLNRIYDLDEIDDVMLNELNQDIDYNVFIENMKAYLFEKEALNDFLILINQRLKNYIVLKIISISY